VSIAAAPARGLPTAVFGPAAATLVAATATAVLARLSPEAREFGAVFYTFLLIALCLLPIMTWLASARSAVPIFEAICVSYAVHFGVTALLLPNSFTSTLGTIQFTDGELEQTLQAVVLGMVAMVVPYTLLSRQGALRGVPALDLPLSASRLRRYLPGAVLVGLALNAAHASALGPTGDSPLWALMFVLINQLNVAIALLCYYVLGTRNAPRSYTVLLATGIGGSVLIGFTTSSLESMFLGIFVLGTIGLQFRSRLVFALMGVLVVAFVVLQPIKIAYRTVLGNSSVVYDLGGRLGVFFDVTSLFVQKSLDPSVADPTNTFAYSGIGGGPLETARGSLGRLDYIHEFALVRVYTPDQIPYYGGSTYTYFFVGWIPRLVWPGKPSALAQNTDVVLNYGILSETSAQTTTASVGPLPEAYVNFGDVGVVVFMALQGVVFAFVRRVFCGASSIGAQSVALSVLFFLVNGVGGITTVLYSGLIQNLAANAVLLWFLAGRHVGIPLPWGRIAALTRTPAPR
jgi:hypothetical protein